MTRTSGKPRSGSKSDAMQYQEGLDAFGSDENQPVSADWLADSVSLCDMLNNVASNLLLTAVCWFLYNLVQMLARKILSFLVRATGRISGRYHCAANIPSKAVCWGDLPSVE